MHRIHIGRAARRIALGAGLLAILVATPAFAQHQGRAHDMEEHLAMLQEKLELSDSQLDQIRAIVTERHAEMEQLHAQENVDHEGLHQLHEEIHEQVRALLTEEQRDRLEQLHEEHKDGHGDHGGGPEHGPHDR
jgi:Spy/CpxP family protein refolding chaperone